MIFTIGYSNKNIETFIGKLREHKIDLVIDVRSKPYSRNPQFNRKYLERYLQAGQIEYQFFGDCLGGLENNLCFDESIDEVIKLSQDHKLVLMCVEKDPLKCHRYLTLTPAIQLKGYLVEHVMWR